MFKLFSSAMEWMPKGKLKCWPCLVVCAMAVLGGCHSDPQTALLERDMRQLEDKNYELQFALEDSQRALEQCRQHCRGQQASPPSGAVRSLSLPAGPSSSSSNTDTEPSGAPKSVAPPTIELPDTPGQDSLPETLRNPSTVPGTAPSNPSPAPKFQPSSQLHSADSSVPVINSSHVQKILLNRDLTGGYRPVGRTIDEGVSAFIELIDGRGQSIRAAGPIAIVVLDPQKEGEAARVGRWDFSAQDAVTQFTQSMNGNGIHLEMPWINHEQPDHKQLELFARFTTSDGRKLEAHRSIMLNQADQQTLAEPEIMLTPPANLSMSEVGNPQEAAIPVSATNDDPPPPAISTAQVISTEPENTVEPVSEPVAEPAAPAVEPVREEPAEPIKPAKTIERPTWSPYR